MEINLLPHQLDFCSDYSTKYLALVGGYGSGKTYSFCMKTILIAAQNAGYRGVIMEPTFKMVKDVLLYEMDQALEMLEIPYDYRPSDMKYFLHFEEGTTEVICLSAENWRRMAGLNLAFFGVDEIDTIKKDNATQMWRMAMSRLREGAVYQGYTTSTPEGFNFLYDFFVSEAADKKTKDRRLIKAKTSDNPFVPKEFIQSLLDNYPANLIKSYLEGEFTNLTSGTVYYAFDRKKNETDRLLNDYPNHILHIGMDFNIGKMAGVTHIIDGNDPYALDEIMGVRNTEQMIRVIKDKYPKRKIIVYPDASGSQEKTSASQSDLVMLKNAGFDLNYSTKNPPVRDRVNSMNAMFCNAQGNRRYKINNKTCPVYTRALEQQVYDKSGEPDKKHDQDHPNDASGYFIHRIYPIVGKPTIRTY